MYWHLFTILISVHLFYITNFHYCNGDAIPSYSDYIDYYDDADAESTTLASLTPKYKQNQPSDMVGYKLTEAMSNGSSEVEKNSKNLHILHKYVQQMLRDVDKVANGLEDHIAISTLQGKTIENAVNNLVEDVNSANIESEKKFATILELLNELKTQQEQLNLKLTLDTGTEKQTNPSPKCVNPAYPSIDVVQAGKCGGIYEAETGLITYKFDNSANETIRCVWTLRATTKPEVAIQLVADELGDPRNAFLTVTPVRGAVFAAVSNNSLSARNKTTKIESKDRNEYIVEGPLVFVILFFNPSSSIPPNATFGFSLQYSGKGVSQNNITKYKHYHYDEEVGSVSYPPNGGEYGSNEVTTFVISTQWTPIQVKLTHIDLENNPFCICDSLTVLYENREDSVPVLQRSGLQRKDYRYCGVLKKTQYITSYDNRSMYILIFKSDSSYQKSGIKFTWSGLR